MGTSIVAQTAGGGGGESLGVSQGHLDWMNSLINLARPSAGGGVSISQLVVNEQLTNQTANDVIFIAAPNGGQTWHTVGPYYIPESPTANQNGEFMVVQMPGTFQDLPTEVPGYGKHLRVGFRENHSANDAGVAGYRIHLLAATDNNTSYGFNATYTGGLDTSGINVQNQFAGTGTNPISGTTSTGGNTIGYTGDFGGVLLSAGTGAGWNIGAMGLAQGATTWNIGLIGAATKAVNGATNVAVMGVARNTGTTPTQVAGWFAINSLEPTVASCALGADNGPSAIPIFLGQRNGTTRFQIDNNAAVTLTTFGASGGATSLTISPGAYSSVTGETSDIVVSPHTMTIITAGFTNQRFTFFSKPTISAASSLTVTNAATVYIDGAPQVAASAVITNAFPLWIAGTAPSRYDAVAANGSVATAMSSLGPVGSHTTIQEWLVVVTSNGTRYIPCF